jgi:hypothetical protein
MEAEAASRCFSDSEAMDFAMAGLSSTKIPKYETSLQLFSLAKDKGDNITLQQWEAKIFYH